MALVTDPTYPIPDEATTITESAALGDVQVIELVSAPALSTMALGYQTTSTDTTPTTVFQIASAGIASDIVTFDERGEYGIKIYDLRIFEGIPAFSGDPSGSRYAKLLGVTSYTLNVCGTIVLPILSERFGGATLRLRVCDATVRAAELIDTLDERSRVAALQSAVVSALAALVGVAVTGLNDTLYSNVNDLADKFLSHKIDGTAHPAPAQDLTNTVLLTSSNSNEGAIELLNEVRDKLIAHIKNGSAAPTPWHTVDDLKNTPITASASNLASATVTSADLRGRVYARHEVQISTPASHPGAGNDTLKTLGLLDTLIIAYLDALANDAPTVPAGEIEGSILAEHKYGFLREN